MARWANAGTTASCFSFSSVTETLQFVVRDSAGTLKPNGTINIPALGTITIATKIDGLHTLDLPVNVSPVQGVLGVSATNLDVVCTAASLWGVNCTSCPQVSKLNCPGYSRNWCNSVMVRLSSPRMYSSVAVAACLWRW